MESFRCAISAWRRCERLRWRNSLHRQTLAALTTTSSRHISSTPRNHRANPVDGPSENVPSTPDSPTSSLPLASSQEKRKHLRLPVARYQDEIRAELIALAKSRNVAVPDELNVSSSGEVAFPRLPRSAYAFYLRPLRRKPTHNIPVANLQLRSYSVRNLEFVADFAVRAAYYLNLPAKGPVPLPRITERWTVPNSNFIFKKTQSNFERVTVRRLVQVLDGQPEVVQRWLAFVRKWSWYGVGMKADVFECEDLNVVERMDAMGEKAAASDVENIRWEYFGTRRGLADRESVSQLLDEQDMERIPKENPTSKASG